MWRTTMSAWVWGCPPERWMVGRRSLDYNVVSVLLLAARRRLARSARLRLLFRDGCAPSATTTLKVMLTASTQQNGPSTSGSIQLLIAKHSLTMFRSHSEILLRHTSCLHLLALNVKSYSTSRKTSWTWSYTTWCLTLLTLLIAMRTVMRTVMRRRMILYSAMTLSAMLYFADVFKRQHWQKNERYQYFSAWIKRKRRRRAMQVILTRSLCRSRRLLYSSYLSDTCHATHLFG